jgi:hypothetical protein
MTFADNMIVTFAGMGLAIIAGGIITIAIKVKARFKQKADESKAVE